jgi:hypothetical protein
MKYYDSMGFESEYGIWVRRAEYDALAAELSAYKEAHEKSCPFVARIRELEAALAAEKENSARGWELFQTFRKKYAELRFPGMTGEVHTCSPLSDGGKP